MHSDTPAAQPATTAWTSGAAVGRYTLLGKIATGGMAEIWLARQAGPHGFEKVVVIKRIIDSFGADPGFVAMFLDEARIAAQLNHPNIVQILELSEHLGSYFMAMEYLHGEAFSTVLTEATSYGDGLPPALAARIVASAAEGLSHAHTQRDLQGRPLNIVHRDVSPMNIFVTYDGVVKVVDFGIAKAANRATQTAASSIKGKVAYMAPEQARGEDIDGRADVFALGVVLFEATTGSRLFKLSDHYATFSYITGNAPIPLAHERNPSVPRGLSEIVAHALERDVTLRFQSAREMQTALEGWLHQEQSVYGASEIAASMQSLFSANIAMRNQMIERAQLGEFTPARAEAMAPNSATPSEPSTTDVTVTLKTTAAQKGAIPAQRKAWLLAATALLALAGGALVFRSTPALPVAERTLATLGIDTEPSGARISVDGVDVGSSPIEVPGLVLGEHRVVATLSGRSTVSVTARLERAGERSQLVVPLPEPALTTPVPVPVPVPVSTKTQDTLDAGDATRAIAARPLMGTLTLDTQPWTKVYSKGRLLGDTPLIGIELPAGRHLLKLVNPEENVNDQAEVFIKPGELTTKKLRLN